MARTRFGRFSGLFIAFALLIVVIVLVAVEARIAELRHEVGRTAEPAAALVSELQYVLARATSSLRGYLLSSDSAYLAQYEEFRAREREIHPELAEYVAVLPPEAAVAVAEVRTLAGEWHRRLRMHEITAAEPTLDATVVLLEQALYRETLGAASRAGREIRGFILSRQARIDRIERATRLIYGFLFLLASLMAIYTARLYWRAEQAIASRDDVLAIVSHDLRNPVNRVRLAAEVILEKKEIPEDTHKMLDMVLRSTYEMTRLIEDLLDVARIEAGTLSIEPAPVDLADLLARLDESHVDTAREKSLSWRVDPPAAPITVQADQGRLLQALGNLVTNAMKFTPAGGEVRVRVVAAADSVRIGVCDSGPGIDEMHLAHVFDRFWQGSSGDINGAGLGLEIARGIAAAHSGRLWLESEIGCGTQAWLEVPLEFSSPSPPKARPRPKLHALNGALPGPVLDQLGWGRTARYGPRR